MPDSNRLYGCLLGTALGDALGLPRECLSPARANKLFGTSVVPALIAKRAFVSDDTFQSVFVLESLYECGGDTDRFAALSARKLRKWFLALPPGIGLSTAKAALRLSIGTSYRGSGVPSAGNGAAMRSAVIGCWFANEPELRMEFVNLCSRVTHTDDRAVNGAQIVALAASLATLEQESEFDGEVAKRFPGWEATLQSPTYRRGYPSGFVMETVPAAIACWKQHPHDVYEAVSAAVLMGGDTDSVAAVAGGIAGCSPSAVLPTEIAEKLIGWPDIEDLRLLAEGVASSPGWGKMLFQHVWCLPIILAHGFRRLAPPYG
jgi:ADP-ribosylglycohydrolase